MSINNSLRIDNEKVLLVDDSFSERMLIKAHLQSDGYQVVEAENGKEALEILEKESFNLVISDWLMPVVNGIELCRGVRGIPGMEGTYFIILTGRSTHDDLIEAFEAGADDFLAKPVNKNELRVRLGAGLRVCRLRSEITSQLQLIQEDVKAAALLQQQMLPPPHKTFNGVEVASHFQPAIDLGGDMLNYAELNEGVVAFYVLDVCGHGAAAAMLSFAVADTLNQMLKQLSVDDYKHPHKLLEQLNHRFLDVSHSGRYFTIALGILDTNSWEISVSQAAHPAALRIYKSTISEIDSGGLPVGAFTKSKYESAQALMRPGETILLYTDGLTECHSPENEEYGESRLFAELTDLSPGSVSDVVHSLAKTCTDWCGDKPMDDDLSFMVLQRPVGA